MEGMISKVISGFDQSTGRNWSSENCSLSSSQMSVEKTVQQISTGAGQQCLQMTRQLPRPLQVNISKGILMWHLTPGFRLDKLTASGQEHGSDDMKGGLKQGCHSIVILIDCKFCYQTNKYVHIHISSTLFLTRLRMNSFVNLHLPLACSLVSIF